MHNMTVERTKFTNIHMARMSCIRCGRDVERERHIYLHFFTTSTNVHVCDDCYPVILSEMVKFGKENMEVMV